MTRVRVDSLTRGSNKIEFNMFYGKLDQLCFDHAHWWPEATPFLPYSAKEGRKWITKQIALKKPIPLKWWNEIRASTSPSGISSSIKLRHKKRLPFSGHSSIRRRRLTNGKEKSHGILTKVALTMAHSWLNQWNIDSTVVHSLNKGGGVLLTSLGNFFAKIRNLGLWKSFYMMQCLFDQPMCKTLRWFNHI